MVQHHDAIRSICLCSARSIDQLPFNMACLIHWNTCLCVMFQQGTWHHVLINVIHADTDKH